MSNRIDYSIFINYIENSKKNIVEISQKEAKKLVDNELPKSFFNSNYIANGKNKLARYILEKGFEFEVIEPKIIIKKKSA